MNNERWTHSNTTIFNIAYHIIWCPKYRRKVLVNEVEDRLKTLLVEKAKEIGCEISIQANNILSEGIRLYRTKCETSILEAV